MAHARPVDIDGLLHQPQAAEPQVADPRFGVSDKALAAAEGDAGAALSRMERGHPGHPGQPSRGPRERQVPIRARVG